MLTWKMLVHIKSSGIERPKSGTQNSCENIAARGARGSVYIAERRGEVATLMQRRGGTRGDKAKFTPSFVNRGVMEGALSTDVTFEGVSENPNIVEEEHKVLSYWKSIDAFNTSNRLAEGRKPFIFYDGPPFATGLPHYGHLLAGIIKDCVTRYNYQCGFSVERKFGWDCHGLPIEYEIEKENNINKKEDILKMGIDVYNEKCRSIVLKYSNEWVKTVERIGRWIDFKNDYKTMDTTFMESVWWVFSELYKRNYVYKSFKVMPYSCKCNTPISNFELNLNYKDTPDPSIIVSFVLLSDFPAVEEPKQRLGEKFAVLYTQKREDCQVKATEQVLGPSPPGVEAESAVTSASGGVSPSQSEILAWTTTPWTLPSNLALCVNEAFTYLRLHHVKSNRVVIVAECRLEWVLKELKWNVEELRLMNRFTGKYLKGLRYKPLFSQFYDKHDFKERAYRILGDDFVTDDAGTGIVHCAPTYGEDDFRVCKSNGVIDPEKSIFIDPIDANGYFTSEVEMVQNLYIKDADNVIKRYLKNENRLLSNNTIVHSYPFCWRSDTPLIYRAIPAWFIRVSNSTKELVKNNETTYWIPYHIKEKKFHNWITDAKDWCISRNRYWGTPIPIWADEKMESVVCVESIAHLEELSGVKNISDLHRHFIDNIEIENPKGKDYPKLKRISEVFDCWFESGSMPYAKVHYPFSTERENFNKIFPADFIAEGLDQTRGWFYTLLVISTLLFDKAPFKNLICNGLVLASDGKKMSKRLKNYPDPMYILDKYGADSLRLYLINSVAVRAENLKFQEKGVNEVVKSFILPFYHSFRFFSQEVTRYECLNKKPFCFNEECLYKNENIMDRWIFSCVQKLTKLVHVEMKAYKLYNVLPKLLQFIENLTNWYIRLNRDRMRGTLGEENCLQSLCTTYKTLYRFTVLMAPFTPFITEYIYMQLRRVRRGAARSEAMGKAASGSDPAETAPPDQSVHFLMLPQVDENYSIDDEIIELIEKMKTVILLGRVLRERRKVASKKPLKSITVLHPTKDYFEKFDQIMHYIKEELNVLQVSCSDDTSCIDFTAVPNYKTLGSKLGANLKTVQNKIKNMDAKSIRQYQIEGKITLDGVTLEGDDIIIQMKPTFQDKDTDMISNESVTILIDFSTDQQLENKANARELCNHVQKMRKNLSLNQNSPVKMHVYIADETLRSNMVSEMAYIRKCLRRELNVLPSQADYEGLADKMHDEEILLAGCPVRLVFAQV
ncbi:isoleucyl-tRNA synthetase [Plasmodium inui San Antonio 1]|uniref:isoleucine--tRNA ligase n=1 Tax=Plasmodium inui San Antonio 1 TaxID=1237626 RepID=W7A7N7_9APIC|nr:isoleucyl-tRNA synthetase [Plasmodium inui San Antonio 1]EUD67640.1 isoleucyl-tRNA synthetase [Plasmodium inui San Antonio 1]